MEDSELALVGGEINASTVSAALTPPLEAICLTATDAGEAARKIARDPAMLAEARAKLSLVSRLAGPTDRQDLYVSLQPLIIMFGPPDFGQDEPEATLLQAAWFNIYAQVLGPLPRESVEIAVQEWLRVGKPFFPKPTELHKMAEREAQEIRLIAWRLRKAVEKAPAEPKERKPEDVQAVRAMIDELRGPDGRITLTRSAAPPMHRASGSPHEAAESIRRSAATR